MAKEAWKVSHDNGFYWWELRNPRIEQGIVELFDAANIFWKCKITESQFVTALHRYFQLVYEESEAAWHRTYGCAGKVLDDKTPLPIDCVNIHYREADFITERLGNWLFLEGEPTWDVEKIHSQWSVLGEQDYSHITLPGIGKDYRFTWGKYGKPHCQLTLGEVMQLDPGYIVWVLENTEKLSSLSDELRRETMDNLSTQKRGR